MSRIGAYFAACVASGLIAFALASLRPGSRIGPKVSGLRRTAPAVPSPAIESPGRNRSFDLDPCAAELTVCRQACGLDPVKWPSGLVPERDTEELVDQARECPSWTIDAAIDCEEYPCLVCSEPMPFGVPGNLGRAMESLTCPELVPYHIGGVLSAPDRELEKTTFCAMIDPYGLGLRPARERVMSRVEAVRDRGSGLR